ncbi:Sorbin and SH3 domain-containing protein 1 homolog [Caenorhabditis elegans]|uniref:Isoform c of Sorbin and SH3 domain-containing protein 1 homolog n=1 Tax=Caenorhabditis elegans TaxID=6239 RepID=G5EC32-2|nr:Sorbin and SH3 domain-containing protein 1 homolog [Caenorhabditis elegans]CAA16388.2 Sorbin and SH3 domain-containing protein 1 homolog [Caenorhabditis elegans]|eukprot:NP_001255756.1 SORBin homolog [Caenorhabditis elegans]
MCDLPKKDVEFKEIDAIYENMKIKNSQRQRSQNSLDLIRITNNLDETTKSLNLYLQQIDATWKRSKSQPIMKGPNDQYNNQERVKQSNEEELLRLKAEKLAEELRKEKERKHSFIPSSAPSLQNNMDRLNSLLYDFSSDIQEPAHRDYTPQPVMTATAVYKFEPRSARELPLNRGDIIRIIREVDGYWMEGERNGRSGIFPTSYVQINTGNQGDSQKMRAIYPFTARSDTELSLKRGEIITRRRQIDSNWLEGSNQIGIVGIFPASYVEPIEQVEQHIPTIVPNRPKTPKIEDQVYNQVYKPNETVIMQSNQGYYDKAAVVPNNKVRFDLPSGSDSNLQMSLNPHQNQFPPTHTQTSTQQPSNYGMKKIEYEREKVVEEVPPMHMDQYRKLNDEPKNPKKDTNILMNAASLIPKGSEMYRAVYPYQPQKEDELQLYTNDIIFVVEKCDDGWFIGTSLRTGDFGIFPGNYVKRH